MTTSITQSCLPDAPWIDPALSRLPGMKPLEMSDWIRVDDAYADQMARREDLLASDRDGVLQMDEGARAAADELLEVVLSALAERADYDVGATEVRRPDGVTVCMDDDPLAVVGRLCQADFCILEKKGEEHVLTGAVLCFPASWTLDEKFMRPLSVIHEPVDDYDDNIARRVQRLFDAVKPGRPLWRANALFYVDAELHQPRRMDARREQPQGRAPFVRSERQSILRLPKSDAVIFSIHTYVVAQENLTPKQAEGLKHSPLTRV